MSEDASPEITAHISSILPAERATRPSFLTSTLSIMTIISVLGYVGGASYILVKEMALGTSTVGLPALKWLVEILLPVYIYGRKANATKGGTP